MAEFVVFRVTSGQVPNVGSAGAASAYRGDHANEDAAVEAASAIWNLPAGVFLYAIPVGSLTRYVTTVTAAVG